MNQNTASTRIGAEIRAAIRAGKLAPGEPIPSAREIVRQHGVALATATKVLAMLKREGLVRVKPGVGTIVRGERAPDLSLARIVEAAIAIADDEGLEAISMRTLGRELGVATMSLYRHVGSREELVVRMADHVLGESPPPKRGGLKWRARLEQIARLAWRGYRRHPWLAATISMTRPAIMRNGMRHTDATLEAVRELGLGDAATLQSGIALIAYIRGMAASLEGERQAETDTGLSSDEWMAEHGATFEPQVAKLPTLGRLAALDVDMGLDALFERGLACFLDGLDAQRRAAKSRARVVSGVDRPPRKAL